jgi:hypothetical protein
MNNQNRSNKNEDNIVEINTNTTKDKLKRNIVSNRSFTSHRMRNMTIIETDNLEKYNSAIKDIEGKKNYKNSIKNNIDYFTEIKITNNNIAEKYLHIEEKPHEKPYYGNINISETRITKGKDVTREINTKNITLKNTSIVRMVYKSEIYISNGNCPNNYTYNENIIKNTKEKDFSEEKNNYKNNYFDINELSNSSSSICRQNTLIENERTINNSDSNELENLTNTNTRIYNKITPEIDLHKQKIATKILKNMQYEFIMIVIDGGFTIEPFPGEHNGNNYIKYNKLNTIYPKNITNNENNIVKHEKDGFLYLDGKFCLVVKQGDLRKKDINGNHVENEVLKKHEKIYLRTYTNNFLISFRKNIQKSKLPNQIYKKNITFGRNFNYHVFLHKLSKKEFKEDLCIKKLSQIVVEVNEKEEQKNKNIFLSIDNFIPMNIKQKENEKEMLDKKYIIENGSAKNIYKLPKNYDTNKIRSNNNVVCSEQSNSDLKTVHNDSKSMKLSLKIKKNLEDSYGVDKDKTTMSKKFIKKPIDICEIKPVEDYNKISLLNNIDDINKSKDNLNKIKRSDMAKDALKGNIITGNKKCHVEYIKINSANNNYSENIDENKDIEKSKTNDINITKRNIYKEKNYELEEFKKANICANQASFNSKHKTENINSNINPFEKYERDFYLEKKEKNLRRRFVMFDDEINARKQIKNESQGDIFYHILNEEQKKLFAIFCTKKIENCNDSNVFKKCWQNIKGWFGGKKDGDHYKLKKINPILYEIGTKIKRTGEEMLQTFRMNGHPDFFHKKSLEINDNEQFLIDDIEMKNLSGLFKGFINNVLKGVFPDEILRNLIKAGGSKDIKKEKNLNDAIKYCLPFCMPENEKNLFLYILSLWQEMVESKKPTEIDVKGCIVVFAPSLINDTMIKKMDEIINIVNVFIDSYKVHEHFLINRSMFNEFRREHNKNNNKN